jgi:fumarylacetoacetate (FAA) hydrolase
MEARKKCWKTVANEDRRVVGSNCIAERRGIEMLDWDGALTDFMRFGDRVLTEAVASDDPSPFSAIDQREVQA